MADFKRGMGEALLASLKDEPLFVGELMNDIGNGSVFFAGRDSYASFYYKGRSLFKYKANAFSTHHKFAVIPEDIPKGGYVTEQGLCDIKIGTSFQKNYAEIKKRAEQYKDPEADGVSALYKCAPATVMGGDNGCYLLDIEISFEELSDAKNREDRKRAGTDRIDFLLYNNETGQLLFCEAKHYTNKELWAATGKQPDIVEQLRKYDGQICVKHDAILEQYKKVIQEYNDLMGTNLREPESIYNRCGLYVFGYNSAWENEVRSRLDENKENYDFKYRAIGRTSGDSAEKIFKVLTGK